MSKFVYYIVTILTWLVFAYDLENDRDMWTWMWLFSAIVMLLHTFSKKIENDE